MIRRRALLALALLLGGIAAAWAEVPADRLAVLRRGVNVTNWFRFPASREPTALRGYLADSAMRNLRRVGFTFVRLAVQPELVMDPASRDIIGQAVARLEQQGLGVVVGLHPPAWRLESSDADRASLSAAWRSLAPVLRRLQPRLTFAEVLNEPVFPGDAAGWSELQHRVVLQIRSALPANTIVLTGNDWGSIAGLLALPREPDPNVVYSFHLYEPPELTALAAYRAGLDVAALARLPFPVDDANACEQVAATTSDSPTADLMRFYCKQRWNVAKLTAKIETAVEWAHRNHVALLAGEFGASRALNSAARLAWIAAVRGACEHAGIGWALWGYDDAMGFALPPPPRARQDLDENVLTALGLAQPVDRK